jgi:hypothetical protein
MPKYPRPRKSKPTPLAPTEVASTGAVGVELETLDSSGVAPRMRLKSATAGHALYLKMLKADEKSAKNRFTLDEMLNGAAPHKDEALAAQGMSWVYNLNFGEADSRLVAALVAYDDLADSSEHLVTPDVRPNYLTPDDLAEAVDVVADEHAKLIREKSDFYSIWNVLAKQFVGHGVGFGYFQDEESPWWLAAGWDNALIPRRTEAKDESIQIFITRKSYPVHELYRFIEEQEYAANWEVEEVHKAIVRAARGERAMKNWGRYWAEIEVEMKNNDLGFGLGQSEEVECLHYRIREFDGSYTFAIGLESGNNQKWLYLDPSRYKNANEAFVSFTLNTGNGFFHSIRGALYKMFTYVQTSNRFQNKMLTNTDIAMTLLLQGDEGDNYDDLQITLGPAIGHLPPTAKIVDRKLPDVGTQGVPVLKHLKEAADDALGQFQSPTANQNQPTSGNMPKYGWQSMQSHQGALTSNSVAQFYRSMDRLANEQWRRIVNIGPSGKKTKSGVRYPEVKEFFDRCKERLQPWGIDAVDFITNGIRRVNAARAIGNGSPQMRLLALDELTQMQGSLDETGRDFAIRDRIASRFGRAAADRYKPRVKRLAPDTKIALLENTALQNDDVPVLPDENHNVHAGIHLPKFEDVVQQIVSYRESNPEADPTPMEPMLQYALRLHTHAAQHVQAMAANPLFEQDMKSYRAALEQGGNLLAGFARELQMQERHALHNNDQPAGGQGQVASTSGQQGAQDQIDASNQRLTLQAQREADKLQQDREKHALSMQLISAKVSEVAQKIRLNQQKTDAAIAEGISRRRTSAPTTVAV